MDYKLEQIRHMLRSHTATEDTVLNVESDILRILNCDDKLAAMEILSAGTMCGIVSYFEWP